MTTARYEFMPYGAPELIDGASRRLFRATASSIVLWVTSFTVILAVSLFHVPSQQVERTIVVAYRERAEPPPRLEPPLQITEIATTAAPAAVAMPVPVEQAPPDQTIASQEEIATMTEGVDVGEDRPIVVVPSAVAEELPKPGDYVYTVELPALIGDVLPKYPEIAREAGREGDVVLRLFVDKDGRVVDVHVDQSIPMLDQAAIDAARQWVFKPALSNNRPVAVWITRRVRFSLALNPS